MILSMALDGFVPKFVGAKVQEYCKHTLNTATKDILSSGLECSHVVFSELIKDPVSMMRNIYKQFGWEFSSEYEANLIAYLKADEIKRKHQFEKAKSSVRKIHDPELFNLDKDVISEELSDYINLYGLQSPK